MSKKIGIFLMVLLVLWSVLLLDATGNRKPSETEGQSVESASAPSVTESTAPVASGDHIPEETGGDSSADLSVEAVLNLHEPDQTAKTHLVQTAAGDTHTADLAELASRRAMNPIAAFWILESEGMYERGKDLAGLPSFSLPKFSVQTVKQYPYTDAGAAQLLTEWLALAGKMENETAKLILGKDGALESGQVHLSEEDGCRYAYFACSAERSTQILCIYLRSDDNGEWIDDVEFQLLHMSCDPAPEQGTTQAVAFAAAAELLMSGNARAGEEETPAGYTVGGFSATAERFTFTAEGEQGSLTNYRLRK